MNPLSVLLAITFAGFVASLALLGMTREPRPVTAAPPLPLRGVHRAGGPVRPRGHRPLHRDPEWRPWYAVPDGTPLIVAAVVASVAASAALTAYAWGPVSRMPNALTDVLLVLIGIA